ncbi:hypothetical protein [Leptospira mayottensis]|uniref:Uncharacterized protein n=2 Tax=Leptospira mayottensis TaxID=1137606 RepID=A0AA87MP43_9LEPT|nr:hypothetical protein [Leptospira mayottensis]AXR62319.1 hypothetical protein DQM68_03540 [Leptospira mayottensis]AXR63833.1 hypothetical protein DQM28_05920 [Leptospira mayottensis]AZQ00758.1 hypothetical protein LEP1GSC190_00420 [Leptospira mayottensis 200901116]EKR99697.1 hypothetical protein LEP1GSC125_3210 [Leptospira mayottensis 200901122]TGM98015.1 hypothetical protein EHR03_14965 [Leptospira mayottensis]
MKFKRKLFFTVTLLTIFLILFLVFWPENLKKKSLSNSEEDTILKTKYYSEMDPYYPDLPHPFNEDPELEVQAKKLWPEAFRPKMTPEEKEEIQREWTDFIARYPKNLYIPAELRPPLTEAQEKELRERLDTFADVESRNVSVRFLEKYSEPGKEPKLSSESNVTPKEQLVYINYRIEELESRIQLIEYTIEQEKLDSNQIEIAKQDLIDWKDELSELKQVQSQIPRS